MNKKLGVRLSFRSEGEFVNAYLAVNDSMKGARLLGSMLVGIAGREDYFERWKSLMSDAFALFIQDTFGEKPDMIEEAAPEHEKAGRA